jgi:predicted transposase YbfD/YdcC
MKETLITVLRKLKDPRKRHKRKKHLLIDIVILTILGVLCGELFGNKKYDFLKKILKLPNGIPSHDTINRVISMIDPKQFEKLFIEWTKLLAIPGLKEVIAIDGKTIRGSKDSFHYSPPVHLVSAWASENGLSFGQVKTSDKSNEITAIPELIEGCIVSIDAMGTQKEIAKKIVEKKADYILALKGNHPFMHEDAGVLFNWKTPDSADEQYDKGHGRIECRKCEVIPK